MFLAGSPFEWESLDLESFQGDMSGHWLGSGNFATVYEDPWDPGKVYKVVRKDDPCFESYVAAEIGPDPHFPEVYGTFELGDGTTVYHMERYEPADWESMDFDQKMAVSYLDVVHAWSYMENLLRYRGSAFEEVRDFLDDHDWDRDAIPRYVESCSRSLCRFVQNLSEYAWSVDGGCPFDLTSDNVMQTGDGSLVFTDPFYTGR